MFGWLRRKGNNAKDDANAGLNVENRVDALANELNRSGRIHELEDRLLEFSLPKLSANERESWHHLWGISAFRRGDHQTALDRFTAGLRECPESSMIQFSLGQEYEHFGDTARMFELFDGCRFSNVPGAYAFAQARYAYLWNRLDKALDYLTPLIDVYYELRIADDTFVYIRGLPFFGEVWSWLGAVYELRNEVSKLREFTETASKRISDFPFEDRFVFLNCLETHDFGPLRNELLHDQTARGRNSSFPQGYASMQLAVLESQECDDPREAYAILDGVRLDERDFPWLDDIRTLAKCAVAHRAADAEMEETLRAQFIRKQPMLFEPYHAFNFRLLQYQENLKPLYQAGKSRSQ